PLPLVALRDQKPSRPLSISSAQPSWLKVLPFVPGTSGTARALHAGAGAEAGPALPVAMGAQVEVADPPASPPAGVERAGRGRHEPPAPRAGVASAGPHELPRRASSRSTTTASIVSSLAPRSSTSIAFPPTISSKR